jgi:hypothetical protein
MKKKILCLKFIYEQNIFYFLIQILESQNI